MISIVFFAILTDMTPLETDKMELWAKLDQQTSRKLRIRLSGLVGVEWLKYWHSPFPSEELLHSRIEQVVPIYTNDGLEYDAKLVKFADNAGSAAFKSDAVLENAGSLSRAAYLVDRFFGFGIVPTTVVRDISGETGSLQAFVTASLTGDLAAKPDLFPGERVKLGIFDAMVAHTDRNPGNYLTRDGHIFAIDNVSTFSTKTSTEPRVHPYALSGRLPKDITENLHQFGLSSDLQDRLANQFLPHLGQEITASYIRRMIIVCQSISEDGFFSEEAFASRIEKMVS